MFWLWYNLYKMASLSKCPTFKSCTGWCITSFIRTMTFRSKVLWNIFPDFGLANQSLAKRLFTFQTNVWGPFQQYLQFMNCLFALFGVTQTNIHSAVVIRRWLTSDPLPVPRDPALDEVLPGPGVGDGVPVRRGVQLHLLWIHGSLPPQGHIPSILFAKSFTVDLKGHQISLVFACWQKVTFSKLENEKDNLSGRYLSGI